MAHSSPPNLLVELASDDSLGRLIVPLDKFLRFSEDITFGLEDLIDDLSQFGTPRSLRGPLLVDQRTQP